MLRFSIISRRLSPGVFGWLNIYFHYRSSFRPEIKYCDNIVLDIKKMNPSIIASLIWSTVHNITALELRLHSEVWSTSSFLLLPHDHKNVLLNWKVKAPGLLPSSCTDQIYIIRVECSWAKNLVFSRRFTQEHAYLKINFSYTKKTKKRKLHSFS